MLVETHSRTSLAVSVGRSSWGHLSEIAPARNRGALSGLNQLMISTDILVAYLVNVALKPHEAWRWMFGLGVVTAPLLLIGTYFQPESPRWLIRRAGNRRPGRRLSRRPDPLGGAR